MQAIVPNEQMRKADEYTIETLNGNSLILMERAGNALADTVQSFIDARRRIRVRVLCVCGGGNNGGDGFVCARVLRERGVDAVAVCFADKYSKDCETVKEKYLLIGGEILTETPKNGYDIVVDALLGTGFKGRLKADTEKAVQSINALKIAGAKIISADIPTGVNGDTGKVETVAVKSDITLCIGEVKAGVYLGDGIDYAGEVRRVDIGIERIEKYAEIIDRESVKLLLPKRKRNSHKGSFGKVAIVAGSEEYSGAAYLSTASCLRSGVGYTTLFLPEKLFPAFLLKCPEALLSVINNGGRVAFNSENFQKLFSFDAVAYGSGLGISEDTYLGAKYLIENYTGKLVLDADAINSLARYGDSETLFKDKKCDIILTPHLKEFSRLTGESVEDILKKGLCAPQDYAKKHGVAVLLKNAVSILSDGERTCVNITGNSGQAKGGSGDILTGLIAGLCAQGLSVFSAGKIGAYLCGLSAEIAVKEKGEYSLLPTDCIEVLPKAFLSAIAENSDEYGNG